MIRVLQRNPSHGQQTRIPQAIHPALFMVLFILGVIYCSLQSLCMMDSSIEVLEWHVGVSDMHPRYASNTPAGAIYASKSEVVIYGNTSFLYNSANSAGGKNLRRSGFPARASWHEYDGYPGQCQPVKRTASAQDRTV